MNYSWLRMALALGKLLKYGIESSVDTKHAGLQVELSGH